MGHIRSTHGSLLGRMLAGAAFEPAKMTKAQAWHMIEPVRCALQRLLDHVGNRLDVAIVGMAFNQAWLRCNDLGGRQADQAILDAACLALAAIDTSDSRPDPLQGEAREAVLEGINLYDRILRASSLKAWAAVEDQLVATREAATPA
ncbi:MAG: hypothetical protein JWQ03_1622 [Variovorax sp.]|nr:hypothetical protein [Variovorax sp.]